LVASFKKRPRSKRCRTNLYVPIYIRKLAKDIGIKSPNKNKKTSSTINKKLPLWEEM
jgi:hypothetical protein